MRLQHIYIYFFCFLFFFFLPYSAQASQPHVSRKYRKAKYKLILGHGVFIPESVTRVLCESRLKGITRVKHTRGERDLYFSRIFAISRTKTRVKHIAKRVRMQRNKEKWYGWEFPVLIVKVERFLPMKGTCVDLREGQIWKYKGSLRSRVRKRGCGTSLKTRGGKETRKSTHCQTWEISTRETHA